VKSVRREELGVRRKSPGASSSRVELKIINTTE
jgi:hypothetical protein